jgi:membrane protein implicated in regulation of membrane protease activity
MPENAAYRSVHFEPLRPASRAGLIAGLVLGPLLWLVALIVGAWLFEYSWAIGVGLLATLAAFLVSLVVLTVLRAGRQREDRRYREKQDREERNAVGR